MRKRLLSVFMVLALIIAMAPAAFAVDGQAATITAYTSDGTAVAGTYTTIDAAVNAAGENGRVVISEGTLAVNGRQTISKAGVTVEGAGRDKTFLVTSDSFQNASTTNIKALLTIAADDVTVEGMTIDGSVYGNTITATTDFVVIRVNDGDGIVLNDVYVTGSPKTLVQLGTGNLITGNSVTVTADDFYCDGMPKTISGGNTYADIDITNRSTLTVTSGLVNGFIAKDILASYTFETACEPLFTLYHGYTFVYVTSTFQHFVNTYIAMREDLAEEYKEEYADDFTSSLNRSTVSSMVEHAVSVVGTYPTEVDNFIILLTDAKAYVDDADQLILDDYIDALTDALASLEV